MKKLYRSKEDLKIAGVCGGLGEYFNVDPVFIRILFILFIPIGGLGILLYIIMWMMTPVGTYPQVEIQGLKRLSLSSSDRKFAGVCGGLGEFFGLDSVLFRVIFLALIFVGGLGVILYVILWLIVPAKK
jgi:phage shock protein PspC (stress-responsive transcriptional regulator)